MEHSQTQTHACTHIHTQKETERDTQRSHIYTKANEKKLANTMNRRLKKKYNKIATYPYSYKNKITSQIVRLSHS